MAFQNKPSAEELATWFAGVQLFEGADHRKYIGGIVCIENKQMRQWNPYPLAGTRIAYFWDWIAAEGLRATINAEDPFELDLPFMQDLQNVGGFITAKSLVVRATVTVIGPDGETMRESVARKQVSMNMKIGPYGNKTTIPDYNAVMRAETGAVSRAVAQLGMLALPGSGIASAEDMRDYEYDAGDGGGQESPAANEPSGRRAVNPKSQS
jgi:hypothetical protein